MTRRGLLRPKDWQAGMAAGRASFGVWLRATGHTSGTPTCGPSLRNTGRTPRYRRPNQPRRELPRGATARVRDAARGSPRAGRDAEGTEARLASTRSSGPVSYTHLTLPTN